MIDIYYIENGLKRGTLSDIAKLKKKKIWIDISHISSEEVDLVKNVFSLHPLTAEDLLNTGVRIKVEEYDEYMFSVFYGIEHSKNHELIEIDFLLAPNVLITNHKNPIASIEQLKKDEKKLEKNLAKGLDFLFHRLLDAEIDNYFPVLDSIGDTLEKIQTDVIKKAKPELLSRILELKNKISKIKKHTLQQREKLSFLAKNEYPLISQNARLYFRDVYDHMIRVHDVIDNYRETSANSFDVYMSVMSNNMNEVMKVLSIIATIALPLTVISGIYGTNFDILPGQHYMYGFWTMVLGMVVMALVMILYFKRKHWF